MATIMKSKLFRSGLLLFLWLGFGSLASAVEIQFETEIQLEDPDAVMDPAEAFIHEVEVESDDTRSFDDFMELYGSEPVSVLEPVRGRQPARITLRGMTAVGIEVVDAQGGEIEYPLEGFARTFQFVPDREKLAQANALFSEGEVDEALDLIRQVTYPLIQFVELPIERVPSIHSGIIYLKDRLIRTGRAEELVELMRRIPEDRISSPVYESAYRAGLLLAVRRGLEEDAQSLAERLRVRGARRDLEASMVLETAHALRGRDVVRGASQLYGKISAALPADSPIWREAKLWEAYLEVIQARPTAAASILEREIGDLDRGDRLFSLRRLVEARIALNEGRSKDALLLLSEGVVFGDVQVPWYAELLFVTAMAYYRLDKPAVADEIRDQVGFFFPDSVWAARSLSDT